MNKKRLFSVLLVGALLIALSATVFAGTLANYVPTPLTEKYTGYLTVFDANATLQASQGGSKYYKVEDMEARITSDALDFKRDRFILGGNIIVTIGSEDYTGPALYDDGEDYLSNLTVTADELDGPNLNYKNNMTDQTADGIFNARYGFGNALDKVQSDGTNQYFTHKLGFEYIRAEAGAKVPVTITDWKQKNGTRSSFAFLDKDGTIEGEPPFNAIEYQTGYIYIPFAVNYDPSNATAGTAPAATENVWEETAFTVAAAGSLTKEEAAFMGWTLDSAAQNTVYAKGDTLPEIISAGSEFTFTESLFSGTNALTRGDQTLYAVWGEDKPGTPPGPDVYEATVTFEIKNGTWDGSSDKIEVSLKLEADGKPAPGEPNGNGEAVLGNVIPDLTNVFPNATYTTKGLWTSDTPTAETVIKKDTTFTYMLTKTEFVDKTFGPIEPKEAYDPDTLKQDDVIYDKDDVKYIVDTVEGPNDEGIYTVTCDKDENGDDTPDKYQLFVTYEVVGGTWKGTNPAGSEVVVVLDKLANGQPSESGYARLNQNNKKVYSLADAEPDARHAAAGTWDVTPDTSVDLGGKNVHELRYVLSLEEIAKYDVFDITDPQNPVKVDIDDADIPANPKKGDILEDNNGDTYVIAEVGDTADPQTGNFPIYVYPDDDENGIPNFAQKDVTLKFVNGTWNGETEKTYQVELKNAQDEWDENGEATLAPFPTDSELIPASDKFILGSWDNADLPKVTGINAETFTYTFAAKEIKIIDPITNDPIGDIVKILRWSGKTKADGSGEADDFKATGELRFTIGGGAMTKAETDAVLAQATFAAYDVSAGAFSANVTTATDQFEMNVDNSGKVTVKALKSGITKVMLDYAGTKYEFVVITPGDANLTGGFDSTDWQLIRNVADENLDQQVTYEGEVNDETIDFFPLMCDMNSYELDPTKVLINAGDWKAAKGLDAGF